MIVVLVGGVIWIRGSIAQLARVQCSDHGVRTVLVPWASAKSRVTSAYETLVIDWLKETSVSAVTRLMGVNWSAIDGIMQRAVKRGLARRAAQSPARICVDETSFRKRHDYVTIVLDPKTGRVLHVSEGRTKSSLRAWYAGLTPAQLEQIESIDMWPAYIQSTLACVPGAKEKIAFDRFHVAKYLGEAVDKVRRQENRELMKQGIEDIKGASMTG